MSQTTCLSPATRAARVAVLTSGGIDSATLVAEMASHAAYVYPLYLRFGLRWEADEEMALRSFLRRLSHPRIAPLTILEAPIADVYGDHWSTGDEPAPDATTDDSAVYLPGRNLLQLTPTAVWCALREIPFLAMGTLACNPFSDSTEGFLAQLERTMHVALGYHVRFLTPYRHLTKSDTLRRGADLPWDATWSCIQPVGGRHCGECNKCGERRRAFAAADMADPTVYANQLDACPAATPTAIACTG